jgi:hypothetical protein
MLPKSLQQIDCSSLAPETMRRPHIASTVTVGVAGPFTHTYHIYIPPDVVGHSLGKALPVHLGTKHSVHNDQGRVPGLCGWARLVLVIRKIDRYRPG